MNSVNPTREDAGLTSRAQRVAESAAVIRSRTKRLYRDVDVLRRLTAAHDELVADLLDTSDRGEHL